jgi:hypothetical protein
MSCQHPTLANNQGKIVSPARHFGDGLDGLLICAVCGARIEKKPKEPKTKR